MKRTSTVLASVVLVAGLVLSGCSKSSSTSAPEDLKTLLPVPVNTQKTTGPDAISANGIRMNYQAAAAPGPAMVAYRTALRDKGWEVTTIVTSEGGTGGGATFIGTHGKAYGVFDGGGFDQQTFVDVCVWPEKPADPNCTRAKR